VLRCGKKFTAGLILLRILQCARQTAPHPEIAFVLEGYFKLLCSLLFALGRMRLKGLSPYPGAYPYDPPRSRSVLPLVQGSSQHLVQHSAQRCRIGRSLDAQVYLSEGQFDRDVA
jgi:hypothetical protein